MDFFNILVDAKYAMIPLKSKRSFDHYIGLALASFFELAAFLLGMVLRRGHGNVGTERVLVMKFQGMGSLVAAYPAIAAFRRQSPEAKIVFWGTRQTTPVARELKVFDDVIELNDRSYVSAVRSLVSNLLVIWKFAPRWAFDLETYSKLSSVLCLWTLALNRAGFLSDTTRFRRYLHTHFFYFNRQRYVGELYRGIMSIPFGSLLPVEPDARGALGLKAQKTPDKKRVVINVNSGELFPLRRWPADKFARLAGLLLQDPDMEIIFIGSKNESSYNEGVIANIGEAKNRAFNSAGASLGEVFFLLSSCSLFITNDSGPMHMGVIVNAPIVAIFGPTSPAHFLPERQNIMALYKRFICSPCVHVIDPEYLPCKQGAPCMTSIEVDEVLSAAKELLYAEVASTNCASEKKDRAEAHAFRQ